MAECCICLCSGSNPVVFQCTHWCCSNCYDTLTKTWSNNQAAEQHTQRFPGREVPRCPICRCAVCVPLEVRAVMCILMTVLVHEIRHSENRVAPGMHGIQMFIKTACMSAANTYYVCKHTTMHESCGWCEKRDAILSAVAKCPWSFSLFHTLFFLRTRVRISDHCLNANIIQISRGHLFSKLTNRVLSCNEDWRVHVDMQARCNFIKLLMYKRCKTDGCNQINICSVNLVKAEKGIFTLPGSFCEYYVRLLVSLPILLDLAHVNLRKNRTHPP